MKAVVSSLSIIGLILLAGSGYFVYTVMFPEVKENDLN